MGANILEVRDLRYSLKGKSIVDGLSLTLEGGRIYALLGKPGSGKTALLRILAGLWPMQEGSAEIEGVSVAHAANHSTDGRSPTWANHCTSRSTRRQTTRRSLQCRRCFLFTTLFTNLLHTAHVTDFQVWFVRRTTDITIILRFRIFGFAFFFVLFHTIFSSPILFFFHL